MKLHIHSPPSWENCGKADHLGEGSARIYDGVDEVHKISVAKRLLREYAAEHALR